MAVDRIVGFRQGYQTTPNVSEITVPSISANSTWQYAGSSRKCKRLANTKLRKKQSCIREQEQRNEVKKHRIIAMLRILWIRRGCDWKQVEPWYRAFLGNWHFANDGTAGGRKTGTVLVLCLLRAHLPDPR